MKVNLNFGVLGKLPGPPDDESPALVLPVQAASSAADAAATPVSPAPCMSPRRENVARTSSVAIGIPPGAFRARAARRTSRNGVRALIGDCLSARFRRRET